MTNLFARVARWSVLTLTTLCVLLVWPLRSVADEPAAAPVKAAASTVEDRWYVMQLMGSKAGYVHTIERTEGDTITTSSILKLAIKRELLAIEISVESEFVETVGGKPIRMKVTQTLSKSPVVEETIFGEKEWTITSTQNGRKTSRTREPIKGEWLAMAAADRYVEAELKKGSKEIVVRTIDPQDGGSAITITRKIGGNEIVEVLGRTVPAVMWTSTVDKYPGIKSKEFVDASGKTVRSEVNFGGMKMVQILADKELALLDNKAPELLLSMMIQIVPGIDNPREVRRLTYIVSVDEDDLPDMPSVGAQRFTRIDAKSGRIVVDLDANSAGTEADKANTEFTRPSKMIGSDDPKIIEIARSALAASGDKQPKTRSTSETAEVLRLFVYGYISKKDMSVGFATAGEVARTKTGDCTEHGVLLAALLRASGIPSRVCTGVVYLPEIEAPGGKTMKDIFGYHMWTQALLPTAKDPSKLEWVDLDATLPKAFDAAHITIGVASLADDATENFLITTAPLIGRLKVKLDK